jgi:hypothetical protein
MAVKERTGDPADYKVLQRDASENGVVSVGFQHALPTLSRL